MSENRGRPPRGGQRGGPLGGGGGPMGMPGEKAGDFGAAMRKLLAYIHRFWVPMIAVLVFAVASTVLTLWTPRIMGDITNGLVSTYLKMAIYDQVQQALPEGTALPEGATGALILDSGAIPAQQLERFPDEQLAEFRETDLSARPQIDFRAIGYTLLLLISLYLASALLSYVQGFVMSGVSQRLTYQMRRDISQKINRLPLSYFDKLTHGEVLSRITNDVDTISQTLNQSLTQIVTSAVTILGVAIMMLLISWQLTLVAVLTVPLSVLLISFIVKRSQGHFIQQQKSLGDINGHIEEAYSGHNIIKVFGAERRMVEAFRQINAKLYASAWKSQFLSGLMMPLMFFVGNIGYVAVCFVGGTLAIAGSVGVGDIQAFIMYLRQFTQPINQLANVVTTLQSAAAAAERVFDFLEAEEEIPEPNDPASIQDAQGAVLFENVVFGYEPDRTIIKDFSADVRPGMNVAIVGPTGAGKTTLVNLLMRFYEVNAGSIQVDGIDIRRMKRADLRALFGMVLQDTWLFQGTIRENILYGKPDATDEELRKAVRAAQVDHFIDSMPGGMDMELNEEVSNISQGERQLLTIARAMLADPPMLILDEATSSVDTRTEVLIQTAMHNLMKGRTAFVIAHRLSTIKGADLILVLNEGNIVEQGTHEELLRSEGFYAELYNSQFIGAGSA